MNKHSKKVNPNRIPVTMADVEKAEKRGYEKGVEFCWAVFFTVLRDKEGFGKRVRLPRVWREVNDLCDSILEGYVNVTDLKHELKRDKIELE